ncbi:hypothetical protein ACOSQ4_017738 [Xanthoceras sorbifolium]
MEALRASYTVPSLNYNIIPKAINKCNFFFKPKLMNFQSTNYHKNTSKSFKVFTISSSLSSSPPPPTLDQPAELETKTPDNEKFDWFSAWCPVIPVNTLKKACVAIYPSTVQHDILWFWPNTDPKYKDIIEKKKPPYLPELDDPSSAKLIGSRDFPYGYEVLIENLADPAHLPYAHFGLLPTQQPEVKVDREGGKPLEMGVMKLDINGFIGKADWGGGKFIAPYIYQNCINPVVAQINDQSMPSSAGIIKVLSEQRILLTFFCIPVSLGNSRLIWSYPRIFGGWIDKIIPKWIFHIGMGLLIQDSDLSLLHVEERKIMNAGPTNWQKACFVPTEADAYVTGLRMWLQNYSGVQINWGGKFSASTLPPTPPREQLMDR